MKKFSFFLLIIIFLLHCFPTRAANKRVIEEKLRNITQTIELKRRNYNKIRQQYIAILNQISYTDSKINVLKRKIFIAKKDLNLLNGKIASLRKEIGEVSADLELQKEKLCKELKSYYEYSKISNYYTKGVWYSYMNKFVTSYMQNKIKGYISKRSYLKDRVEILNRYLKKKRFIINRIKVQQSDLDKQKKKLNKLALMAASKKKQYIYEIRQLTEQRKTLKNLLKKIIEEEKLRAKRLKKLKENFKINPKLVEKEFKVLKHKIRPPVTGKVIAYFGKRYDPVFRVYTKNDGIDIRAKKGSCVHVIAYGKIGFVGNLPGYGGVVIVNHLNGYYTVYGGINSSLKVGQIVKAYQCIGRLSSDRLHFEIRRHATPVNPLYFLDRRFLK